MKKSWRRSGGRSEISLLVLCGLLLLVVLSSFQLFAFRDTLSRLQLEQQELAAIQAREIAPRLVEGPWPSSMELRSWLPGARSLLIFDPSGAPVEALGGEPDFVGTGDAVSGEAAFMRDGLAYRVEVRLASPTLSARQRSLAILTPLVVTVNLGILALLAVYTRRWLRPLDLMLDRAKALGNAPEREDEVAFLVRTFEHALKEMAVQPEGSEDEGLKALEGSLVRSMQSGVLLTDRGGQVLALNEIGGRILEVVINLPTGGAPLEEVLAVHPDLVDLLRLAFGGEAEVQRQECSIEVDSGRRELGLTAHPLRRDDGEVQGWLVMFADLTDIKRRLADERLSESLRQIGEVTAGVAHEMRNGLATLKGYLALIERSEDSRAVSDYVSEIRQETEHLHRVLEDFLDFARPGSMRTEDIDVVRLAQRVAADPARGETAVRVEVDPELAPGSGTTLRGDPVLLARALSNLVTNAWQAQMGVGVHEPVILAIRPGEAPDVLSLSVEDRGPGLPEEVRERLFEAFVSGSSDGVGLGLPLTRRIVLMHGGQIHLESRLNGGTVARVDLPMGSKGNGKNVTEGNDSL